MPKTSSKFAILIIFAFICLDISLSIRSVQAISAEEYIDMIIAEVQKIASKKQLEREIAYEPEDYISRLKQPDYPLYFVRIKKENLPIFTSTNLSSSKLNVLGLAKSEELFLYLSSVEQFAIINPLGNAPAVSGTWHRVLLLNGHKGWIPAKLDNKEVCTLEVVKDPMVVAISNFFGETIPKHLPETIIVTISGILLIIICCVQREKARQTQYEKRKKEQEEREKARRERDEKEKYEYQKFIRQREEEEWEKWMIQARSWSIQRIKVEIIDLRMQINKQEAEFAQESQMAEIYDLEAGQYPHPPNTTIEQQKIEFLKSLL